MKIGSVHLENVQGCFHCSRKSRVIRFIKVFLKKEYSFAIKMATTF